MKLLVVYGGSSAEREVSLRSGQEVGAALVAAGHEVTYFDPGDDTAFTLLRNMILDKDVVFPILHGTGGEDGAIQYVLEQLQMPFVGSSSMVSRNCFDKVVALQQMHAAGIVVPSSDIVNLKQLHKHPFAKAPFVLKPRSEGSSVGVVMVRDPKQVRSLNLEPVFARYGHMMIEVLIDGIELTVPVLGQKALPVVEIIPPTGGNFDYQNKYNGQTQELCPPPHISPELQTQAQTVAESVHMLMGCRDLSRTDFMLSRTDNKLYCLEINTLPGMTSQSLYPKSAVAAGLTFPQLVNELAHMAYARKL